MHDQIITTATCTKCGRSEDVKKMLLVDSITLHCTECKPAHTPAPWYVLDGAVISKGVSKYGNHVVVTLPNRGDNTGTDEANARLIAAAPELLDELKQIYSGWNARNEEMRGTNPLNEWESERYKFLSETIAKAEGRDY